MNIFKSRRFFLYILIISALASSVFASETNGTINSTYKYAWGENIGWINFGCDNCGVSVTDTGLSGYAWSRQYGWINLNPDNGGVDNDSEGTLSGYAWSSNLGWINFTGVTIGSTGEFSGYATVDSDGSRINFNCSTGASCASSDFKVTTDWRPASSRATDQPATTSGSAASSAAESSPSLPAPTTPPSGPSFIPDLATNTIETIKEWVKELFDSGDGEILVQVPVVAPLALKGEWDIIPESNIASFVFAPLPYEIRILAGKFPELEKTLSEFGIEKLSDIGKLSGINLNVPSLAELLNKTINSVGLEEMALLEKFKGVGLGLPAISGPTALPTPDIGAGNIALIEGLPVADFSLSAKKSLPAEFVFARSADESIDLGVELAVDDSGKVNQRISTLPGKATKLVVKPLSAAKGVTGYVVFKSSAPRITRTLFERSALTASVLFSMGGLVEEAPPVPIERKLVLSSFKYEDPDGDGIYTADFVMPIVPGEYEIVTIIDYVDPELGSRKMSMVTVIDPEGYVYEENDGKETRVPGAVVSLFAMSPSTGRYALWDAKAYSQDNPQTTDIRGTYSFLVPAGTYYFHVEAPGYRIYEGKPFRVTEGDGVHMNIKMEPLVNWLAKFDLQTALLIVVVLLLMYNLYRNTWRDKLAKYRKNGTQS